MAIEDIINILKKEVRKFDATTIDLINLETDSHDKVLISAILSSRTKDKVTLEASKKLFSNISCIKELKKLSVREIEKLIYPVGFYKTKAKHLKELSKIVSIPKDFDGLVKLPGVGRKVANLYLSVALGRDEICVDTHVHRISNRLGWVKAKTPFETEKGLKNVLPKKYWKIINSLLVSYGQRVCTPRNPKCRDCMIQKLCKKVL